ncbi:MAG: hypothetical protein LBJ46_03635 [Planctomycetota bacterium]|nr:hypothetical protein [Planctomycetota bacterium]
MAIIFRDFVANVSHELRTPITAIQNCLETLQDNESGISAENDEFVAMALWNTKRMGAIIDNLLFLAGMESGSAKSDERTVVVPVLPVIGHVRK